MNKFFSKVVSMDESVFVELLSRCESPHFKIEYDKDVLPTHLLPYKLSFLPTLVVMCSCGQQLPSRPGAVVHYSE